MIADKPNGITLGEEEQKLGIKASSTRQVFYSDTKIPVENMLSERGKGFKIAMNSLNVGRIKLAAACIDACRRFTTESITYATNDNNSNVPFLPLGPFNTNWQRWQQKPM